MSKPAINIKYYLSVLSISIALSLQANVLHAQVTQLKAADNTPYTNNVQSNELSVELNQAELDQILAPIALYPDTLLSHILVAATYPLEVIQAARWRLANKDLDEQQALNAVEDKDWDPSVKALIPFNDLLQRFSEDLNWLQALGDAFLNNEEQVLSSVQTLRQKAYAQGNLNNNQYIEVSQENEQITIQPVQKEVIYVPYYDTRVVYGPWWWDSYQPYYWNRPSYYVLNSGVYWSPSFHIGPTFYFGGFRWRERYVYADYAYRSRAYRSWPHDSRRVVVNREYSRWQHNETHRRGVHYTTNGQAISRDYGNLKTNPNRYVTNSTEYSTQKRSQIDKQRVLDIQHYQSEKTQQRNKSLHDEKRASQIQQELKVNKYEKVNNNKQRLIDQASSQQRSRTQETKQYQAPVTSARQSQVQEQSQRDSRSSTDTNRQQKTQQTQYKRQEQSKYNNTNNTHRQRESSQKSNSNSKTNSSSNKSHQSQRRVKE
ncbi:DUF3300 domain-containing protein [Paraglaciecola sp. 25GB23A]|uniref:DUF3300 domain-containing protein n=1 Tax=Paraglaciecola sp. 25GB23A TaxID=3156068 RepID=UPI0032AED2F0